MPAGLTLTFWFASQLAVLAVAIVLQVRRSIGLSRFATKNFGTIHRENASFGVTLMCGLAVAVIDAGFIAAWWVSGAETSYGNLFYQVVACPLLAFALSITIDGAIRDEVEPLLNFAKGSYRRFEQPVRYWLSMFWNGLMSLVLVLVVLGTLGGIG